MTGGLSFVRAIGSEDGAGELFIQHHPESHDILSERIGQPFQRFAFRGCALQQLRSDGLPDRDHFVTATSGAWLIALVNAQTFQAAAFVLQLVDLPVQGVQGHSGASHPLLDRRMDTIGSSRQLSCLLTDQFLVKLHLNTDS